MAKKKENKMANHAMEATGLRVISMYIQEYFHWGWQPYGQENDDGIDGEIIPRTKNGFDMGVRIKVQSKCGPGYLSSINTKTVNIQPYSKESLKDHVDSWNHSNEPVILVYTNPEKTNNKGKKYLDLKNPTAWWMRMDDYQHDGSTVVRIPIKNLFQEHTKGELKKLIKPYVREWVHYPYIVPEKKDLQLWNSFYLLDEAKQYYKDWKLSNPQLVINNNSYSLSVSRTGWRHIINKQRKDRVPLSLKLLPIAHKILEQAKDIRPVVLRTKKLFTFWDSSTIHLGYRARVLLDGKVQKVQVVVRLYENRRYNKKKIWFYSVHLVK